MRLTAALLVVFALSGCFFRAFGRGGLMREAVNKTDPACAGAEIDWSEQRSWLWKVTGCAAPVWCSESPGDRSIACSLTRPPTEEERQLAQAAAMLGCLPDRVTMERIELGQGDPQRDVWGWWAFEFTGCGKAVWCGEPNGPKARVCENPPDYDAAVAQLALETQCASGIAPMQRQVFVKRATFIGKGQPTEVKVQTSWRLEACGGQYVCTVSGGLAPAVACKAALATAPVATPPPPPPPAQP